MWQTDWEPTPGIPLVTSDQVTEFNDRIEQAVGRECVITYSSDWLPDSSLDLDSRAEFMEWRDANPDAPLWYANYDSGSRPTGGPAECAKYRADVWQWTDRFTHPSVVAPFDMNMVLRPGTLDRICGLVTKETPMTTLYPSGYGKTMVTIDQIAAQHRPHMHPEAFRRGMAFIVSQGGKFGVGGGYRPPGTQPTKPGFAPAGKSFHQDQEFPAGRVYVAWDMVVAVPGGPHRAPRWADVPAQGSQWAADCGVHMNVPTEPWHMQPVEIDGWDSWVKDGRKDIVTNYPIKGEAVVPNPPTPNPPLETDDMKLNLYTVSGAAARFIGTPARVSWTGPGDDKTAAAIETQIAAGNLVEVALTGGPNAFAATFLDGPLPVGDSLHDWTGAEFANTATILAGQSPVVTGTVDQTARDIATAAASNAGQASVGASDALAAVDKIKAALKAAGT
jgi:hypothetical protein